MNWNRTTACVEREEMSLSSINYTEDSTTIDVVESIKPNRSTQITPICYTTQTSPPSHNDTLPVGHSSPSTNEPSVPPCYEEMIESTTPPPSGSSMYGRIRKAHNQSTGTFDFLNTIIMILLGTIGCTIVLTICLAIPVAMIVIGGVYLYDCPLSKCIPIYLLVSGSLGVFKQLLDCVAKARQHPQEKNSCIQNLVGFFLFVWFITGSILVYKEYEPNYDPSLGKYCNKTLYLFAFWQLTACYICLGVVLLIGCCCMACML